jgi:hypothetical protein
LLLPTARFWYAPIPMAGAVAIVAAPSPKITPPWQLTPDAEHGLGVGELVGLLVFFGWVEVECFGVVVVGLLLG